MALLKLNTAKSGVAFSEELKASALAANSLLHSGKGAGNDFLGWVNLPSSIDKAQIDAVAAATKSALEKYTDAIKDIADRDFTRAVFLGSGELMGVAEESRLKLQELTDGTVMCAFDSFLGFLDIPFERVHRRIYVI